MNGRKYDRNYAPRAHGFNLRSSLHPVGYFGPKRFERLNITMWMNFIRSLKRMRLGGGTDELWSCDGRARAIDHGKTLSWWRPRKPNFTS